MDQACGHATLTPKRPIGEGNTALPKEGGGESPRMLSSLFTPDGTGRQVTDAPQMYLCVMEEADL